MCRLTYDPCPLKLSFPIHVSHHDLYVTGTTVFWCFDLLQTLKIAATPIADTDELLTSSQRASTESSLVGDNSAQPGGSRPFDISVLMPRSHRYLFCLNI